ncbi:hypothetical protein KALB_4066 [Kutzneria albida DSM 43870]|uniref:Uncharacterized protein n=1 Tax=Kutzneria albida DSM 43870 TaxID=1449976 RepID=W5W9J4_9PSEU|nr:hypothetical protein KALB_4066 [Kutzneria albida DSM 43870]
MSWGTSKAAELVGTSVHAIQANKAHRTSPYARSTGQSPLGLAPPPALCLRWSAGLRSVFH